MDSLLRRMESGVFFCWFEILTFVRMTVMKAGMTVKSVGDPDLRQDDVMNAGMTL